MKLRELSTIIGCCFLLLITPPAMAQDSNADLRLDAARELLVVSDVAAQMGSMMEYMSPLVADSFRSEIPNLTSAQAELISAAFVDEFSLLIPGMIDQIAGLYAERFTLEELNTVIGFYQSETGAKFIALTPVLTEESRRFGEVAGQQAAMNAMPRIMEIVGE